jgi:hypothetical protein
LRTFRDARERLSLQSARLDAMEASLEPEELQRMNETYHTQGDEQFRPNAGELTRTYGVPLTNHWLASDYRRPNPWCRYQKAS